MNPENTLCLVVDVQERLLPVLHGADEMVGRCRVLLQGMRALGVPLLATEQYPKGLGKTVPAVQLLLDEGADPTLKNELGLSAVDFATRVSRTESAEKIAAAIRRRQPNRGRW